MQRFRLKLTIAMSITVWLAFSICAEAQEPSANTTKSSNRTGDGHPNPEHLLRQMADYVSSLPAFSCQIELSVHIQADGIDNRIAPKATMRLQHPNRLALLVEEGAMGVSVVSDGKKITQYIQTTNRYTVRDAPATFAELNKSGEPLGIGVMSLPSSIIPTGGEQLYKALMDGVTDSQYVGTEEIGDVLCHRCRFLREDFDWDVLIDAGEQPLARKVVLDFSKQFANAAGRMKDAKLEYSVVFSDWNVAPMFTDADFALELPADAEEVATLSEGFAIAAEEGPHPLLGQPAPQFKTVGLEEQPIDLSAHVGKEVVMLDFWATWCGPCVEAMPEVDGVAKKFADRGLVFYAVNVAEDADTIKEFLKTSALEVPVAMDLDGAIAQQYQADGIPQTVLIGKDGKVQVVHVGFSPDLADQLTKQIEDLLEGKDLAGAALAEASEARQKRAADDAQTQSTNQTDDTSAR